MVAVAELERRMRPGAWSGAGFLGERERLDEVLARDERTLTELGVTCNELAEGLSLLIEAPFMDLTPEDGVEQVDGRTVVGGRYEVEASFTFGAQECPWGSRAAECGSSGGDWCIRDPSRGLELSGPHLIAHLIREHSFFEGLESPYRVDPQALAELVKLGTYATG